MSLNSGHVDCIVDMSADAMSRQEFMDRIAEPMFAALNRTLQKVAQPEDRYVLLRLTGNLISEAEFSLRFG